MIIDRVKLTAHFDEFGVLKDTWVGLEGQIDDTEAPENKLDEIKAITERWYRKQNPQLYIDSSIPPGPPPVIATERTSEDTVVAELIRSIYSCTELDGGNGLFTYFKLASRYPEAQAAYDVMKNKLRIKETKEIMDATSALTAATVDGHKLLDGYNKNTKIKK